MTKIIKKIVYNVFFSAFCFLWVYPFLWLISGSFKTQSDMFMHGLNLIPEKLEFTNISRAWVSAKFSIYLLNSCLVTIGVVLIVLVVASLTGYALGRGKLPGKSYITMIMIAAMFLPASAILLPTFQIINALNLNNTRIGVILAIAGPVHAMAIMLFMRYFASIPDELEEAARLDGANYFQTYWHIMVPLSMPIVATVGIFNFIGAWNNFMIPLVFTLNKPNLRTLGVGLYSFFGEGTTDWPGLCAAAAISTIPIMVVFLSFQKYFIGGLEGAIKG